MSKLKKLTDKYFVKEDGFRINKKACKEDIQAAAFDVMIITMLVVGGLAVVGLATIGVQSVKTGANTLRKGANIMTSHFRK